MKKPIRFILTALIIGLVAISNAKAEEGFSKNSEKWEKKFEEINKQLGITPEQETQLKKHREKHHAALDELHNQVKAKKEEMGAELQIAELNMTRISQIHDEIKSLRSQMEDLRLSGILEVRQILTPDQFKRFTELKKNHQDMSKEK